MQTAFFCVPLFQKRLSVELAIFVLSATSLRLSFSAHVTDADILLVRP